VSRLAAKLAGAAAPVLALLCLPAAASADCALPAGPDPDMTNVVLDVEGDLAAGRAGSYLQIPFTVPAGVTGMQIRYSYDQPGDTCSAPPGGPSSTLDIGLYEPRDAGESVFGMDELRGWSGSAVRNFSVAENGFSDEATYGDTNATRRAFVPEATTRAYRPGSIPEGQWAVELGAAFIAPDLPADQPGIDYHVEVRTTSDPDWADSGYEPSGYSAAPVATTPGWYAGDFHVHGEQEPGNAPMSQTFSRAFDPPASGGAGLDFVTIVDHNNNVAHDNLASYQASFPSKLIVPGVEETTYRGHHNNHGKGPISDFRGGPVLQPEDLSSPIENGELAQLRGPVTPAQAFATERAAGNLAQINHPEIFRTAPSFCRGCAWSYDSAETDYSTVDSIEVQTGPAGIPLAAPAAPNPFILDTLAFYERALDTGAHIAAVGSSDDHQGGDADGPFDAPVGSATTMVYADELSEQGVKDAVRADRTYVKFFGNDGPDVALQAVDPGVGTAIIGGTLAAPEADLNAAVLGIGETNRPGSWSLVLLKNGAPAETVPVSGNDFNHSFEASGPGRYSLEVIRSQAGIDFTEVYTSPIWLEGGGAPDNRFKITKVKLNKKRGTAKATVKVPGPGVITASGGGVDKAKKAPKKAGKVKLQIEAGSRKLERKLERRGKLAVKPKFRYTPDGGEARAKKKRIKLKQR
jgi:hypothetical protein